MSDRILSNRYKLESELGRGGMGVVYRAQDTQVKRTVAIKTLPAIMTHNPDLMRRFQAEVQHASKLEHPNIVRVYDVGEDDGTHYYVMQYIEGSDLRAELKQRGRYPVDAALAVISQLAEALDYAHSQGIVHRDIKPENILLDAEGQAHIVDFGIAKAVEGTRMTRGLLGTPEYMSPEQVKGNRVDGRSDQYSLAVLAYELLTGRTPFPTQGDDPWAQINMHLNTPPPNPRATVPDLPAHVANALLQALAKDPGQRFGSCGEFVKALHGEVTAIAPEWRSAAQPKSVTRIMASLLALFCLFIVVGIVILHRNNTPRMPAGVTRNPVTLVAFSTSENGPDCLCTISVDGEAKKRLAFLEPNTSNVISSSDGSKVWSIIRDSDKNTVIALLGPDGIWRKQGSIKSDTFVRVLAISPDGKKMLYTETLGNSSKRQMRMFVANLDGTESRQLAQAEKGLSSCSFSPDGRRIAFVQDRNIYIADIDGSGLQPLTYLKQRIEYNVPGCFPGPVDMSDEANDPSFSPDGTSIIYTVNTGRKTRISVWIMGCDGEHKRAIQVPAHLSDIRRPIFSPDGTTVLFQASDSNRLGVDAGVYTLTTSGSQTKRIADGATPIWIRCAAAEDKPPTSNRPAAKSKNLRPVLPDGYRWAGNVSADFDGDGDVETAFAAEAKNYTAHQLAPFVAVCKGDRVIWKQLFFFDFSGDPEPADSIGDIQAVDISGDGVPELLLDSMLYGASTTSHRFYVFGFANETFVNQIPNDSGMFQEVMNGKGKCFQYNDNGGVEVSYDAGAEKCPVLCFYGWAKDGPGYAGASSPNPYEAEFYTWQDGKLHLTAKKRTQRYYDSKKDALTELGISGRGK
jgi:serine/threonine protein kinase